MVAVLVVLSMGGTALGQGDGTPRAASRPAAAPAGSAVSSGCGKAPTLTSGTHTIQTNCEDLQALFRSV
ncbi:hypothetical protein [Streptomyces sp. NPDC047841]|uniref:hypothetical protein n=1 Tax=Streptomyces sp. NPDC047841 TaxID=3154708 RepID=UPI0034539398